MNALAFIFAAHIVYYLQKLKNFKKDPNKKTLNQLEVPLCLFMPTSSFVAIALVAEEYSRDFDFFENLSILFKTGAVTGVIFLPFVYLASKAFHENKHKLGSEVLVVSTFTTCFYTIIATLISWGLK